jgi:hypothetical protein
MRRPSRFFLSADYSTGAVLRAAPLLLLFPVSREELMNADLIETINREFQHIPIGSERWKELSVELSQFLAASEAARVVHDFDRDPADFQLLLRGARF